MTAIKHISQLIHQQSIDEALRILGPLLDNAPDNAQLWCLNGWAAFETKNFKLACASYERATLLVPLSLPDQVRLAISYSRIRRRDIAKTILLFVGEFIDELDQTTLAFVVQITLRIKLNEIAKNACEQGRRRFPENAVFWAGSAQVMNRILPAEVIELFLAKAAELEPDNAAYRISLSRLQLNLGDHEAAKKSLNFDISGMRCYANLQRLKCLFEELCNTERVEECDYEISRLYHEVTSRRGFPDSWD